MATMSVRKLHVFLLVTLLVVAVSSASPLLASEEEVKRQEGLTDMDLEQLSQLQRNVSLNQWRIQLWAVRAPPPH